MKSFLLILTGLLFSYLANAQIGTGTKDSRSFVHSGVSRTYNVYKPISYNGTAKVPLVLVLHPGVGVMPQEPDTMNVQMERYSHFDLVADTANFLICYPNSRRNEDNDWAFWDHDNSNGWNDASFLDQLIDTLIQHYKVDTCRIFLTGFSTGAYMSYSMACEYGQRLAAIAPVSGQKRHLYNCNPAVPVPVFHIHGTDDMDAVYNGDLTQNLDSVATILRLWYTYNNCNSTPVVTNLPDINTNDNSTITKYYWQPIGANNDNEVIHYKVNGGGHGWPGAAFSHPSEMGWNNMDIDASVEIWNFFRQHKKCNTTIGIKEINTISAAIYPNPAKEEISIKTEQAVKTINIYSISGQSLFSTNYKEKINISNLSSGIYIIELVGENGEIAHSKLFKD